MTAALKIAAAIPALAFILLGLSWWVAPVFAAEQLGMDLLGGVGLTSQIADLASFFLTAGACVLIGVATRRALWFYPAIMLLAIAMVGRLIAWLVHGGALTLDMMAVEATVIAILLLASRQIPQSRS